MAEILFGTTALSGRNRVIRFGGGSGGVSPLNPITLFADGETGVLYREPPNGYLTTTIGTDQFNALIAPSATNQFAFAVDQAAGSGHSGSAFTGEGDDLFVGFPGGIGTWVDNLDGSWSIDGTQVANQDLIGDDSAVGLNVGDYAIITFTISGANGTVAYFLYNSNPQALGNGTHTIISKRNSSLFRFRAVSGRVATVSNIEVCKLPGLHASQATSTFRATYQTTPARATFDGVDDRYVTGRNPTTTGSIAAYVNGSTASRIAFGAQGASDGRCFIALASDGSVAGGIGANSTSTIKGSTDRRGEWVSIVLTWDDTTVKLYENGVEVYSGAQNGAVTTTVPFLWGCNNNNTTAQSFWPGSTGEVLALDRVITAAEAAQLHTYWSA
jgi:hypothetical protein